MSRKGDRRCQGQDGKLVTDHLTANGKTHLQNTYQKLYVASRRQAVEKAKIPGIF
jgi:hypothetical protein